MLRYIAHALNFESAEILRTTGSPKARNEIPNPRRMDSISARRRKKGSWEPVGSGPTSAGGQMTGPNIMAGAATSTVTANTFIQVFITNVLLSPDVVTGLRPSLVSLRDLLSVSLARFSSFPVDFSLLPCRHLDPPSGAGNMVS